MTENISIINQHLHSIIDELHPLFTPISDEQFIENNDDHGVFTRDFLHQNGKKFRMKWRVYFGTPETVRTEFDTAEVIE